jgi:hypothetical protein
MTFKKKRTTTEVPKASVKSTQVIQHHIPSSYVDDVLREARVSLAISDAVGMIGSLALSSLAMTNKWPTVPDMNSLMKDAYSTVVHTFQARTELQSILGMREHTLQNRAILIKEGVLHLGPEDHHRSHQKQKGKGK